MENPKPITAPGLPLAADGAAAPARPVPPVASRRVSPPVPTGRRNSAWFPIVLSVVLHVLLVCGLVFAVQLKVDELRPKIAERARANRYLPPMALTRGEAPPVETRDVRSLFVPGKELADGNPVYQSRIAETSAAMMAKVEAMPVGEFAMPPADEVIPESAVEGALSPTKLLKAAEPVYPRAEREAGHEGVVSVRVLVRPDGTVGKSFLFKTCGFPALDAAAVKAARRWKFSPWDASRGPAAFPVIVSVSFKR